MELTAAGCDCGRSTDVCDIWLIYSSSLAEPRPATMNTAVFMWHPDRGWGRVVTIAALLFDGNPAAVFKGKALEVLSWEFSCLHSVMSCSINVWKCHSKSLFCKIPKNIDFLKQQQGFHLRVVQSLKECLLAADVFIRLLDKVAGHVALNPSYHLLNTQLRRMTESRQQGLQFIMDWETW